MLQNKKNTSSSSAKNKLDVDINGAAGEIACAKYFNVYFDTSISPHRRGYDIEVSGVTIDVKTTSYNPGALTAKTYKKVKDANLYVLVHCDFPKFTIMGGAIASELLVDWNIKDTGYGRVFHMDQSQLRSIDELIVGYQNYKQRKQFA